MCPKTEGNRGDDTVVGISSRLTEIGYNPKYLIPMWGVFNHAFRPHLILNPFRIIENRLIVTVYGIAQHNLEDIEYAIKLLA